MTGRVTALHAADTASLIDGLSRQVRPVRPLSHPARRMALWVLVAAAIIGLLALEHGVRPDLAAQLRDPVFQCRLGASLLTGLLAVLACLIGGLPDRSRLWLLLPLPSLALWLSTIGYGCLTNWISFEAGRFEPGEAWRCFATLLLTSLPLSLLLFLMLRHAALLRPRPVVLTAGLAVAAVTASAMSLLHPLDATIMILIWNLGAACLVVMVEAALGVCAIAWFDRVLRS